MKKQWKDRWIKALLSGEYVQGKEALCTEGKKYDKFCCLGVLCDIADPNKWGVKKFPEGGSEVYWGRKDVTDLPPYSLLVDVGLSDKEVEKLASMNDNGHEFEAIAKYIKKNL